MPYYYSPLLLLTSIPFLLSPAHSADPLNYNCTTTGLSFSPYDSFHSALFTVFSHLYTHVPHSVHATAAAPVAGSGSGSTAAYGLAYCRGDASHKNCSSCIAEATVQLPVLCPGNRTALVWYDNCFLKYSDQNFFGQLDISNQFALVNVNTLTLSKKFVAATTAFLGNLSSYAAASSKQYSEGEVKASEFLTLYGYAQCSGEFDQGECRRCLGSAVGGLISCCGGRQGARFGYGSCTARYEIYPILNSQTSSR